MGCNDRDDDVESLAERQERTRKKAEAKRAAMQEILNAVKADDPEALEWAMFHALSELGAFSRW